MKHLFSFFGAAALLSNVAFADNTSSMKAFSFGTTFTGSGIMVGYDVDNNSRLATIFSLASNEDSEAFCLKVSYDLFFERSPDFGLYWMPIVGLAHQGSDYGDDMTTLLFGGGIGGEYYLVDQRFAIGASVSGEVGLLDGAGFSTNAGAYLLYHF